MPTRTTDLQVRIGSTFDPRGAKSAEASWRAMERELLKLETAQRAMAKAEAEAYRESDRMAAAHAAATRRAAAEQAAAYRKVSTGAGIAGAAIALGLGAAARAAMDWETAWAGVTKVVSGSPAQLAALQAQLRGLAKELPASAEEIAGVAAAAGQLGVARQDIINFTRTAIALGVSTNLSAEDAATGLAKLGNIMGVLPSQVDRAGAALVALGNEGASTEADILEMAVRIAGAARQVGATEAEVLGLSNALTSVGLNAEEGGTAISRVILNIDQAVSTGGAKLASFAAVAGQTSAQFATIFRQDPAGGLQAFIAGLGRMQKTGQNTVGTLEALGLQDVRVRDTLLRAASASDLITASLKLGATAWSENSALTAEASKRYETTASRLQIARNTLNDAAIDLGNNLAPALANVASGAAGTAAAFQGLPGPVKEGVAALGEFSAVGLLSFAGLAKADEKIRGIATALKALRSGGVGAGGLAGATLAAGGLATALGVGAVALGIWAQKQAEARQRGEELRATLDQQTGAVTQNTRAFFVSRLQNEGVLAAANKLGVSLQAVTDAALGNANAQAQVQAAIQAAKSSFEDADVASGKLAGTYAITAKNRLPEYNQAVLKINGAVSGSNRAIGEQAAKVREANSAMGTATPAALNAKGAIGGLGDTSKETADKINGLKSAIQDILDQALGLDAASDAFSERVLSLGDQTAAIATAQAKVRAALAAGSKAGKAEGAAKSPKQRDTAQAAAKKAASDLAEARRQLNEAQLTSRDNLRSVVQAAGEVISKMVESGASAQDVAAKVAVLKRQIYDSGTAAGVSRTTVQKYANALDAIPGVVATTLDASTTAANQRIGAFLTKLHQIPGHKTIVLDVVPGKVPTGVGDSPAVYRRAGRSPIASANGGIVIAQGGGGIVSFADGGYTYAMPAASGPRGLPREALGEMRPAHAFAAGAEHHIAQLAPAGSMRLWAEAETGGEAYIPLSAAKRGRSKAVIESVIHRFGGEVTWSGPGPTLGGPRSILTASAGSAGRQGSPRRAGDSWASPGAALAPRSAAGSGLDSVQVNIPANRWPGQPRVSAEPRERVVLVKVPIQETHTRTAQFGDVHVTAPTPAALDRWARTAGTHT